MVAVVAFALITHAALMNCNAQQSVHAINICLVPTTNPTTTSFSLDSLLGVIKVIHNNGVMEASGRLK